MSRKRGRNGSVIPRFEERERRAPAVSSRAGGGGAVAATKTGETLDCEESLFRRDHAYQRGVFRNKDEKKNFAEASNGATPDANVRRKWTSDAWFKNAVHDTMRIFMLKASRGLPIRRNDSAMWNAIFGTSISKKQSKMKGKIFSEARKYLDELFGLTLVGYSSFREEFGDARAKDKTHKDEYYLVNKFQTHEHLKRLGESDTDDDNCGERGFLMIVLSLLFSNGGELTEEDLWGRLKLDFKLQQKTAPEFLSRKHSNVKELFDSLVRQKYIDKPRKEAENGETVGVKQMYNIGRRAIVEIGMWNILEFLCKILGLQYDDKTKKRKMQDFLRSSRGKFEKWATSGS